MTVDGRVLYRIMLAATETKIDTDREACILGAILRCLLDPPPGPGHFDVPYVMDKTAELNKWGRWLTGDPDRFPNTAVDVFDIAPIQLRFRICHKETRTT